MRFKTSTLCLVLFLAVLGCKSAAPKEPPYSPGEGAVAFDLVLESGPSNMQGPTKWLATYQSGGHAARFRLEFGSTKESSQKPLPISFGKGRFVAVPGSDNTALMAELQEALEAKGLPEKSGRAESLPFEFVNLGCDLYRTPTGLSGDRKGNWCAIKLFLGNGQKEGEVFLNLNSALGKGEFSLKDPDYGDFLVAELARVL